LRIQAKLCYDDEELKPVDFVKQDPMSYKIFGGERTVTVEFRLFCLSSQHEDSCFRIRIAVTSNQSDNTMEVISEPIRVVSKAKQVAKEQARSAAPRLQTEETTTSRVTGTKRAAPSSSSSSASSDVQDALLRLEQQQKEQLLLLQQLAERQTQQPQPLDFETAFTNFIRAYQNIPCEDRPSKVRKVMSSPESSTLLADFLLCGTEDYSPVTTLTEQTPLLPPPVYDDCTSSVAVTDCGKMMDALDSIYTDLTWSPESDPFCGETEGLSF